MRIFGLMMVRDEADILCVNVLHHLAQGVDRFLVVDNGSSDGTAHILEQLSRKVPLYWESYDGPYHQSEITTALAHEAYLQGADWVIPIDADEFWCARGGTLRDVLQQTSADVLRAEVVNFVQRRDQVERSPEALLHMTKRPPAPIGPLEKIRELAESRQASYVQLEYPSKCVSRVSPAIEIGLGNHSVQIYQGAQEDTTRIVCLHAAVRARSVLETLASQGRRAEEAGNRLIWNWLRWQRLSEEGGLEAEWRANSYEEGYLDVYGVKHDLVEDFRLRDAVAPWIGGVDAAIPKAQPAGPGAAALNLKLKLGTRERTASFLGDTLGLMENTEGWFTTDEGRLLVAAAVLALIQGPPGTVVEVGSYLGRSTVVLGRVLKELHVETRVHAIDPHEGTLTVPGDSLEKEEPTYGRFLENVRSAGLEHVVEPIRQRSLDVQWDQPVNLLLVDALHDYENVSADFRHFDRWVVPGGYVVFHDYGDTYPGVKRFVDEIVRSGGYQTVAKVDILNLLKKVELSEAPHGTAPHRTSMTFTSEEPLRDRLERQTKGISILQEVVRSETAARSQQLGEKDKVILGLQEELFSKVGEGNRIIQNLQAELHEKVGERDATIRGLQEELQTKIRERDEVINKLQKQLQAGNEEPG